jgi:hypothetical protein
LHKIIRCVLDDERGRQTKLNKADLINIAMEKVEQWLTEQNETNAFIDLSDLQVPSVQVEQVDSPQNDLM